MSITSQFAHPYNAIAKIDSETCIYGKLEFINTNLFFWSEDRILVCAYGEPFFKQVHPLDTDVLVPRNYVRKLTHAEMLQVSSLPSGNSSSEDFCA